MFILDWETECKTIVSSARIEHSHLIWNLNQKAVVSFQNFHYLVQSKSSLHVSSTQVKLSIFYIQDIYQSGSAKYILS